MRVQSQGCPSVVPGVGETGTELGTDLPHDGDLQMPTFLSALDGNTGLTFTDTQGVLSHHATGS